MGEQPCASVYVVHSSFAMFASRPDSYGYLRRQCVTVIKKEHITEDSSMAPISRRLDIGQPQSLHNGYLFLKALKSLLTKLDCFNGAVSYTTCDLR